MLRAASERRDPDRAILVAVVVAMAAIAAAWLGYELYRLIAKPVSIGPIPVHPGGIDLLLPHLMVNDWFAGLPVYTGPREGQHPHPPASMAILWPVYGGPSLARATAVYLLVTLASLAWIVVVAVRESGAAFPSERALVALVPLATYPAGATIGNGQTTVYALAAALAALLLLRDRPPGRGRDLAVAALFLVAMFFSPLVSVIPHEAATPALVIVGFLMMTQIRHIDFTDYEIGIPAFLTMVLMPFTYSITNGIGAGFITYCLIKAVNGKAKEVPALLWVVSAAFIVYFAYDPITQLFGIS